jgi:hypothetical protein
MDSISSDARRFEDEFALLLEGRGKIPAHQDSIDRYWSYMYRPIGRLGRTLESKLWPAIG